ncbi:hypothetical protein E8E13_010717 [Curvularia kusanoi]|uniref:RING-type domain-containing protein n=1 Tax=Curvularia kusanoi TaxID=90978 RepID=A0A9P4WDD2_CURKU|nr:hypothetical protein E8E13_010717 [Curvularia kusanoi]
MADSTRSAVRRRLGRETARLITGKAEIPFDVHEELICALPYFRKVIQPRRKPAEGECPICKEEMNSDVDDLSFCSLSCGTNFHRACVDEWHSCFPDDRSLIKCPLCRQKWYQARSAQSVSYSFPKLNPEAFEIYFNWLYGAAIPTDGDKDSMLSFSIAAYMLGSQINEPAFCEDALRALIRICLNRKIIPTAGTVTAVYAVTAVSSPLRKLLLCMYMEASKRKHDLVLSKWDEFSPAFQKDFLGAIMQERVGYYDRANLERKFFTIAQGSNVGAEGKDENENENENETGPGCDRGLNISQHTASGTHGDGT